MSRKSELVIEWRKRAKLRLVYIHGGKCGLCDYDRCISALEFHHIDPTQKEFGVAVNGISIALRRLIAEAAKCIMVCSNCHREIHAGMVESELKSTHDESRALEMIEETESSRKKSLFGSKEKSHRAGLAKAARC